MLQMKCFIFILSYSGCMGQIGDLQLISKSRSAPLAKYTSFADAVVMNFIIPENVIFGSIVFEASEQDLSIFGCTIRNVSLHLKQGALPVINPDSAPFPDEFKNISRPQVYNVEFQTDQKQNYVNITSPEPGTYYAAIFLAYEDPRYEKISQQGLTQSCQAYVDASVYVVKIVKPTIIAERQLVDVIGETNQSRYFMFMVPEGLDHAIINIDEINFSPNQNVNLRVAARRPPTKDVFLIERNLNSSFSNFQAIFQTFPRTLYYISFDFDLQNTEGNELTFVLRYFSNRLPHSPSFIAQTRENVLMYNMSVDHKIYLSYKLTDIQPYKQFNLVKETSSESFTFSFKLSPEIGSNLAIPINVTNQEFTVLKFSLQKGSDTGGTLQYILAFKPRVMQLNGNIILQEEPKDYFIVGCIQKNSIAVPTWPKYCLQNDISIFSPLILNETITNSTVLIPYPESGTWYASFKLFCGSCQPCQCPKTCQKEYEQCTIDCELNCTSSAIEDCENCVDNCSRNILTGECSKCNCDGPCMKNSSNICTSSVVFDVSSRACYYGGCGKQGRCGIMISEGVAYSTCLCNNNYRGFDCSDGSLATPYYLVILEFLLLILSNIFFLPVAYVAYKREYYVETLTFCSVFLSSSFYHACDAGENIISFCIFRLSALQFADFFTAVLATWLTLLAIADIPQVYLSLLQMAGSIVIAFCVTLNRYALWIFALPSCLGIVLICLSWYLKFRKFGCHFINRRVYLRLKLPTGVTVVVIGLVIYGLLQTQNNYKYLHSLWHLTMAMGVFFILPTKTTFAKGSFTGISSVAVSSESTASGD